MLARFFRSTDAATLPYIALILLVLLGLIGLGYDFGRQFVMRSELQKAADAAAVAGAYQLDLAADQSVVFNRVDEAVAGAAITANETRFANLPGEVEIASWRGLSSIPADDDDPIDASHEGPPYAYVEVTTEVSAQDFSFLRLFGGDSLSASATAVAGRGRAVCTITPMAICNPAEEDLGAGAPFNPDDYMGRQIIAKAKGEGTQWAPGDFGYLDFGNGVPALREALGSVDGANACFETNTGVDIEPGQKTSLRPPINTRFDIYENPGFRNEFNNPRFAPAENVTKGYETDETDRCNDAPPESPNPDIMALPRDTDLSEANRIGNGEWDCETYWTVNHPGASAPAGCSAPSTNDITRFEVYLYEIQNGIIPNNTPAGENGNPGCSTATPVASSMDPDEYYLDRRVITMAVLNCKEHGVSGSADDVPVEAYLSGFLTEPVPETPDDNVYLEVIGSSILGQGGLAPVPARDWVEVVR